MWAGDGEGTGEPHGALGVCAQAARVAWTVLEGRWWRPAGSSSWAWL